MKRRGGTSVVLEGYGLIGVLKGYGRGSVTWSLQTVIENMSSLRDLRGMAGPLKPTAHELAKRLLGLAADPQRNEGNSVSIPPNLLSKAVLLLLTLPGPQRGRPKMETTLEALRLRAEGKTKRGAARVAASNTGEDPENIRRRLRSKKTYKPKRKGGT